MIQRFFLYKNQREEGSRIKLAHHRKKADENKAEENSCTAAAAYNSCGVRVDKILEKPRWQETNMLTQSST